MHLAARTVAALFLAIAASHGLAVPSEAAASGKYACWGAATDGKRCAGFQRRASRSHAPAYAFAPQSAKGRGSVWGRRKIYAGSESTMRQLSPRLRPRRMSTLRAEEGDRPSCEDGNASKPCRSERNLADALIQPPNAATTKILRETGIPIIPGVPPIAIVRPPGQPWVEDLDGSAP